MAIIRELRIPVSDASRVVVPCTEEKCNGEAVVDLLEFPVPKEGDPVLVRCSRCGQIIQPPVTTLLAMLQSIVKAEKPSFYFIVPDPRG